ncbi:uncharacterized protein A1O5_10205 [Cladophialophora psammophila CBS 110553]|uniref:F-box domain-containing protein n=1 Tax=Cladophialophora psammophila CBS 110553 TaxID=1182543 RepID=W9WPE7_9EURO|nr:uncharacterized protein A1O5_10205 [Cladophialophora psammophila CBS 110553]EXJ66536.1 hypothetical protein A1O5_10205 [Cladophialophora psammophila CBS 110553]
MALSHSPKRVKPLLENCLEAVRRRDYTLALTAVNDALKVSDIDKSMSLIQILEHRVAVYLRLDRLDQALKDAKAMIRLDPKDARGYIRAGVIERRKNNKIAAMRFLEYGLKKVPDSDANHGLLVKEMKETADQMRTEIVLSQAKDPLVVLPLEVIEIILSFLDYRSNIRLLRVSKSWNKTVSSSHPLVDTLAFPNTTKQITPKSLITALKRCRTLRTVKVSRLPGPTAEYLAQTLSHWERFPALQYFEWRDAKFYPCLLPMTQYDLRVIIVGCGNIPTPIEWIRTVLQSCRSLEIAKFQNVRGRFAADASLNSSSLRELELHSTNCTYLAYDRISLEFPQLKVLSCKGISYESTPTSSGTLDLSHMTKLRSLDILGSRLLRVILPASLRQLSLVSCVFLAQHMDCALCPALNELQELRVLNCDYFPLFVLSSVQKTSPGKLSKCSVTVNEDVAQQVVNMMSMPWFQSLKYLRIVNANFISADAFAYIKNCSALEELCFEQAGAIGVFVSDLIRETGRLRKVTLLHCPNVARDIIPWAKERGVEVEIHQGDMPAGNGRRVVESY